MTSKELYEFLQDKGAIVKYSYMQWDNLPASAQTAWNQIAEELVEKLKPFDSKE